jgi:hypothetical protein
VADGAGAVRTTYSDGGQHLSFTALLRKGAHLGEVSRPEALAFAGREIVVIPARPKRPACPGASDCPTQVADATGTASPAIPADADLFSGTEPWLLTSTPIGDAPTGLTLARATDAARLVPVFLADTSFRRDGVHRVKCPMAQPPAARSACVAAWRCGPPAEC